MDAVFLPEGTKELKQEDLVLKKLESSEKTPEIQDQQIMYLQIIKQLLLSTMQ